jgi:hypothetical protein
MEVVVDEVICEGKLERKGDVGVELDVELEEGGSVSQDSVRRHDCRIMENEVGWRGS